MTQPISVTPTYSGGVLTGYDYGYDSDVTVSAPSIASDRGYLAWSLPPFAATAGSALATAGTVYLTRLRRVPAGTVTNIIIFLSAGGSTLTVGQCFAALYDSAGTLLGTTADQSTSWASAGFKTMPLSGGSVTRSSGDLYVAKWFNGTTGPSLYRSSNTSATMNNAGLVAPDMETATANTGVTTSAPATLGTQTAAGLHYWVAVS